MFNLGILLMMFSTIPMLLALFMFFKNNLIFIEMPMLILSPINIPATILMDWISSLFLFTVMFISANILIFSTFYIPPLQQKKFSLLLMAFVMSMCTLILSDNLIFILLGWDGLGLSSYILVIYYQNFSSSASGTITVLSNRIGDIFILIAISMMVPLANWSFSMNNWYPGLVSILILLAASSKSAQFPFSAWLPAAMAAPTPISALVHSSTLVTAGVYLLIRTMNYDHPLSSNVLMMTSSLTAIYASMSASWEQDLKKIIALSTLSQIAMMMFALSIKAPHLALFHLITHAMFKSMMFMSAGAMIHLFSYQDTRHMGNMMNLTPLPPMALGVSSMALMGLPFMSGFFSKDSILELMISSNLTSMLTFIMLISVGMTATYTTRMLFMSMNLTMKTKPDTTNHPSKFMDLPLILMTPMSIALGSMLMWLMTPQQIFILPLYMKYLILTLLLSGMVLSAVMTFNSKNYMELGLSAISIWFLHFLSTHLVKKMYPYMMKFLVFDKTWKETMGPQMSYSKINHSTKIPTIITNLPMNLVMILILPLLLVLTLK